MLACQEELQVTEEKINKLHYWIAENQNKIVGFYALDPISNSDYELEALFVDPTYIGKGFGKALIIHAKIFAASLGAERLIIQGDPNAEKFYLAAGGELTGELESGSIPGRVLPTYCISLTN
jgi:N-acetylglutamate synthase-like GNAT family acetyltransferase